MTNSPSNASAEFGYHCFGGGWITSLETLITESEEYELGICFFHNGSEYKKLVKNNVTYYGIPLKSGNIIRRIIIRHRAQLIDEDPYYFNLVIDEFKPDIIHVYGTEKGYGKILMNRKEKVIFHLQGLVAPYADVFFPPGFSKARLRKIAGPGIILRGLTYVHNYRMLWNTGKREQEIIKHWNYFNGRTEWDRNYIKLLNPAATYFHCEELLRKEFYENEWSPPSAGESLDDIVIGSTINPNLYKGLDLVYKVLYLLKGKKIRWKVFGIQENSRLNETIKKVLRISNGQSNIEFYGHINSQELIEQLRTCHIFVHPSYIDNSPNSVCEAMMLGMPVLSSSVGGVNSLIENKQTGFLFNPYDAYDLAGLINNIMMDYSKARQVALNARQVALKRHAPGNILSDLKNIYTKVLQSD